MRRRPSNLMRGVIATAVAILLGSCAGCEARVYGAPPSQPLAPHLTAPQAPPPAPAAPADPKPLAPGPLRAGIDNDVRVAIADARERGADIEFLLLDRSTGQQFGSGGGMVTASVAKLFIADDLLMREPRLSPEDRAALDVMLRSSDDNAAEEFWNRGDGSAIISRVAARYGLHATRGPSNGRWWNTVTSARDLVRYYDMLLDGSGGLPAERANIIINNLAQFTPAGIDGYPQGFGIPDGLATEPVAVKQGWMCCIGADWMHLSTGIIGADRRYVMVVYALQPTDDATARTTITDFVKTMFPGGRL